MADAGHPQRRQAELRHARDSLRTELKYWRAEATQVTLEKHQTQIQRVADMIEAALKKLDDEPAAGEAERILDLYHVWDFFRAKLALRYVEPITGFLDAADELAWAIYRPTVLAAAQAGAVLREPPLVFLDRGTVPFASARGSSYRDLLPRDVRTRVGAAAASKLPFPVIGVPWYLCGHLPGALLVAHEVGHHVEDDCGLTAALEARLTAVGLADGRLAVWQPWLGEVFADVVASVTGGMAYPAVLFDALANAPAGGAGGEHYPPPRVRARVCLSAAGIAGLPVNAPLVAEGDRLGAPDPADDEAPTVVKAILTGQYDELGGQTMLAVLNGSPLAGAPKGASLLLAGLSSSLTDIRAVLAAAALAFARDPQGYDDFRVGERAVAEVLRLRPVGPRNQPDPAARAARDAAAGRTLLSMLIS